MERACAGFVLAGGRSTRMGTDKALLNIGAETLLERAAHAVEAATGSVSVVGDPARYGRFGYPMIEDRFPGAGPLAGIEAALASSHADWNLIVACDMPGVEAVSLGALLEMRHERGDADVLLPECGGYPQPLCAAYHRRALGTVNAALARGQFKVMDAISGLRVARIPLADEALFRNVNTPEEWQAALQS